ncbi:sulfite exporter TauE/SafE family protein [Viridibacterium curvum]|uniref:Probable membrane transporter protein n=1 Tax=Viridibacterium curvum TaxID=1101404 RepID=A0ABP9QSC0_9RHOO
MLTAIVGAVLIGLIMGSCGAGGGILTVPLLIATLGLRMQEAAPIALVAICSSTAIGAIDGLRAGLARYRAAGVIAACSLPFTSLGLHLAAILSQHWLVLGFAGICLISALRMLFAPMRDEGTPTFRNVGIINAATGRFLWSPATAAVMSSVGAASGMMTGLFGVGGGFVIVPMLRRFTHLSQRGSVATSLLVMALVSSGGVCLALLHGVSPPPALTLSFAMATVAGLVTGRLLNRRLPSASLQRLFAIALVLVGVAMLLKAIYQWH